jgi:uncharacterized protein (TIGR03663 family)
MTERRPAESSPEATDSTNQLSELRRITESVSLVQALLAITVLALVVRLVGLGVRPMHFDEGRVAYWSLYYIDSGNFAYRPIVHGPFIQLVNAWLAELFGPSDFLVRLPVALVGTLLPASVYLYREHLRKSEAIALALFLAFNSVFLYYSRFLRSDILLAGFMFAGFGCLVRLYDTRKVRYFYGALVLVALGLTTKENGLVYLLTWVGATVLLVDNALFPPRGFTSGFDRIRQSWVGRFLGWLRSGVQTIVNGTDASRGDLKDSLWRPDIARLALHAVAAVLLAFLVLVFFYADRGAGIEGYIRPPAAAAAGDTGLYEALGQPLSFPGYAVDTVEHAFWEAIGQWGSVSSGGENTSFIERYITTLGVELDAIRNGALAVGILALLGMVWERYATRTPRNLVMFMSYCGLASLVGYSLKNDPGTGKWLTIHILLPLLFPAAVGASRLYRWGMEAYDDQDTVGFLIALLVLVSLFSYTGVVAANTSYVDTTSEGNELVQFAQPEGDSRAAFTAMNAVSAGNGTDVAVYMGESHRTRYGLLGGDSYWYKEPTCIGTAWTSTLPLPWYFAQTDANVSCHSNATTFPGELEADQPGMVITKPDDPTVPDQLLRENYTQRTFNFYRGAHPVRFWVHEDYTDEAPGWDDP